MRTHESLARSIMLWVRTWGASARSCVATVKPDHCSVDAQVLAAGGRDINQAAALGKSDHGSLNCNGSPLPQHEPKCGARHERGSNSAARWSARGGVGDRASPKPISPRADSRSAGMAVAPARRRAAAACGPGASAAWCVPAAPHDLMPQPSAALAPLASRSFSARPASPP